MFRALAKQFPGPVQRAAEADAVDWLENVIHRVNAVALHGISGHAGDEGDQHFIIFLPNLPGHAYAIHAGQLNVKQQQIIAAYGIVMIQHIRPVIKNVQLAHFIQFIKIILDFLTNLRLMQSIVFHKRDFHAILLSRSYLFHEAHE